MTLITGQSLTPISVLLARTETGAPLAQEGIVSSPWQAGRQSPVPRETLGYKEGTWGDPDPFGQGKECETEAQPASKEGALVGSDGSAYEKGWTLINVCPLFATDILCIPESSEIIKTGIKLGEVPFDQ